MHRISLQSVSEHFSVNTTHIDEFGVISEYKEEKPTISVTATLWSGEEFYFNCSLKTKKLNDKKGMFYAYLVNNWVNYGELAVSYQSIIVRYGDVKYTYIVESVNELV